MSRRRSIGAEVVDHGVHFRVWAPNASRVAVVMGDAETDLAGEPHGYFSGLVKNAAPGMLYKYRLDRGEAFPDPASRFQPEGPHGPSMVIDPSSYRWRDTAWRGASLRGQVISEIHIGTFTREGTFAAAIDHLDALTDTGITCIEVMPVNEFAGAFGWGYDGVDLFAPYRLYGEPDDFRRFVDAAHQRRLAVILDVVYNHLGPDGCYLAKFAGDYFTKKYENEWGEAINFDGENSRPVREFFVENACHWIDEYHLDGLRLDATQSIHDASRPHIIREIGERAREAAAGRTILFIAENEPQDVAMIREHGVDAMWNDDWHHSTAVSLTGRAEAYYSDYRGSAQELVSMAKLGFLFQGQHYHWQKKRRGTPSVDLEPERLVLYLQNHDQIANSARGERLQQIASAGEVRAMTALLLLLPQTPMLFQGQEFGASAPWLYFADHEPELAAKVAQGRFDFLAQFPSIASLRDKLPLPHDRDSFERCKLDWSERETNAETLNLHRDLLRLRREDPMFAAQRNNNLHGSVIGKDAFALRWFGGGADDRLLIVNLRREFQLDPVPEPILAPPAGFKGWETLWSSDSPEYGGSGVSEVETEERWDLPGRATVVLRPQRTADAEAQRAQRDAED
ncbi:MAG TPA: malto-oligosyltrehalose trehalohydrolase [Thermoanaerobaculia bacterium]|nr:malto-oligosyltrehalose trehalohydrolase [Thermoanaerobaculia bacterium]